MENYKKIIRDLESQGYSLIDSPKTNTFTRISDGIFNCTLPELMVYAKEKFTHPDPNTEVGFF